MYLSFDQITQTCESKKEPNYKFSQNHITSFSCLIGFKLNIHHLFDISFKSQNVVVKKHILNYIIIL